MNIEIETNSILNMHKNWAIESVYIKATVNYETIENYVSKYGYERSERDF